MPPDRLATPVLPALPLPSGQSLWLCLPPGGILRATLGTVTVRWTPQSCGLTLHTPSSTLLAAGEPLAWPGPAQATWVQVHNPARAPAEIQLEEPAPAPMFWQRILWRLQRIATRGGNRDARNAGFHRDACHAAR